jgi:hypothetical protein
MSKRPAGATVFIGHEGPIVARCGSARKKINAGPTELSGCLPPNAPPARLFFVLLILNAGKAPEPLRPGPPASLGPRGGVISGQDATNQSRPVGMVPECALTCPSAGRRGHPRISLPVLEVQRALPRTRCKSKCSLASYERALSSDYLPAIVQATRHRDVVLHGEAALV